MSDGGEAKRREEGEKGTKRRGGEGGGIKGS